MLEQDYMPETQGRLWGKLLQPVIPYQIIDRRLTDLAQEFWDNPDHALDVGYRRLEANLRNRLNITDVGRNLISKAFLHRPPLLTWHGCSPGDQEGRAAIFSGTIQAHRNLAPTTVQKPV